MMLSQWCKLPLYLHDTSKKQILARCVNISSYNPIPNKQPLKLSLIVSVYYCTSISYFDDNITLFDHYCTFVTQFHYTRLVALWYFLFMHIVFVKNAVVVKLILKTEYLMLFQMIWFTFKQESGFFCNKKTH